MLGIIKTALLSASMALNPSPDDAKITEYNSGNENLKQKIEATKQVKAKTGFDTTVFDTEIQVGNTIQIPAKKESLDTDPETKEKAEALVTKLSALKDYKLMDAYLSDNMADLDKKILNEAMRIAVEKQVKANKDWNYQEGRRAHYQMVVETGDPAYQKNLDSAINLKNEAEINKNIYISVESRIKIMLAKLNAPTAEYMAKGVDNIAEIPNNLVLKDLVADMQMTFEDYPNYKGALEVYINNNPTGFPFLDENTVYYPAKNGEGIIFEQTIDKEIHFKKFALELGKVEEYGMRSTERDYGKSDASYELTPKQIKSEEKVSMVKTK